MFGQELTNRTELDCPTIKLGGWTFCPVGIDSTSIVFSLGIANDIGFDTAMIDRFDCAIHAFDPTPRWIKWLNEQQTPPQFHFYPCAIGGKDGTLHLYPRVRKKGNSSTSMMTLVDEGGDKTEAVEVIVRRIPTFMSDNGLTHVDILKMDIEAAEYEVIDDLLNSGVQVYQLLVEFHHRFKTVPLEKTKTIIQRLTAAGYRIFHISEKYREFAFIHEASYNRFREKSA
jgi:FkbM family methyltransferase